MMTEQPGKRRQSSIDSYYEEDYGDEDAQVNDDKRSEDVS